MKRFVWVLTAILLVAAAATAMADRSVVDYSATIDVYKNAPQAKTYFASAYGYAVFPTVGKGGFVIGGGHGKGQVYRGGKVTGFTSISQVTVGFQAGGQAFSEIVFLEDKRAYDEFTSGNFEFDATASAVAITAGAQASTGGTGNSAGASAGPKTAALAKVNYRHGMATFIHAKGGLMYEATLGGQKFTFKPVK